MDEKELAALVEAVQELSEQRIALTIQQLVAKLGIGRSTYFKLRAEGKMPPSITVGRRRLTTISALNRWLQKLEEQNNA